MPYFSRLTDIVTCNLTSILKHAEDPDKALDEIIQEMQQGVEGAKRSATTAANSVASIETEIGEQRQQISHWLSEAQQSLTNQDEQNARLALQRKHEIEDLIAGLEQQLSAAVSTREHLVTMRNALEARLADARRRKQNQEDDSSSQEDTSAGQEGQVRAPDRQSRIDAELESLRNQMKTS